MENKENINANVYVEQVDTIGEAQSIIRQHETKYTLKYIQYYGSKDFGNTGTPFGISYLSDVFNLVCFSLHYFQ